MFVKTNFYHLLDPKHSPHLLINRNQAKLISMFAPSFPILLSAAAPPNTQGAINYNSNSKLFTIALVFIIIVPSCYQHSTQVLSLLVLPFHSLTHSFLLLRLGVLFQHFYNMCNAFTFSAQQFIKRNSALHKMH